MKTKRNLLILALTALLAVACNDSNTFQLSGQLDNGAGKTIYVEEISPNEVIFIDSVKLDNQGHFSFEYAMPYESIYTLHTSPTDYIMFIPKNGEKISVTGDYNRLSWTYEISGSPESTILWQLQDFTNESNMQINSLVDSLQQLDYKLQSNLITQSQYDNQKAVYDSIFYSGYGMMKDYVRHLIQENSTSLASLIAVHRRYNNNQQPLIDPEYNTEIYEQVLSGLQTSLPDNPHTKHFYNEVAHYRALNTEL